MISQTGNLLRIRYLFFHGENPACPGGGEEGEGSAHSHSHGAPAASTATGVNFCRRRIAYVNGFLIPITVRNPKYLLSTRLCHRRVALPNYRHTLIYLETSSIICEFAVCRSCSASLTGLSIPPPAQMDWRECASSHHELRMEAHRSY
jgi:hypothetical protein